MLEFDNSHCWTHTKEVLYSVKVIPPEGEKKALLSQEHAITDTKCLEQSCSNESVHDNVPDQQQDPEDSASLYFTPSPGSASLSPADSREDIDR